MKHHIARSDYTIWRDFLTSIFHGINSSLSTSLTHWQTPTPIQDRTYWHWFTNPDISTLYERVNDQFALHTLNGRRRQFSYDCVMVNSMPDNVKQASVDLTPTHIQFLNSTYSNHSTILDEETLPPLQDVSTIRYLKKHLPPWSCQRIQIVGSLATIKEDIEAGKALLVSDGSLFPLLSKAGASWIIATHDCQSYITGGGALPSHDSYRSELCGLIGLSAAVQRLLPLLSTSPDSLVIACDGKMALGHLHHLHFDYKTRHPHSDMVTFLIAIWREMECLPTPTHVYGHQDNQYGPRTALEHLNIMVDLRAKIFARTYIVLDTSDKWKTYGFGTVCLSDQIITGCHKQALYDQLSHNRFVTYLSNKWEVDADTLHTVAWDTFGKARKETTHTIRIFISKWLVGHLPTGQVMTAWKFRKHARCPHCQHDPETLLHILTCPSQAVRTFWIQSLEHLHEWLEAHSTDPHIASFFLRGLLSWTRDPNGYEIQIHQYPQQHIPALAAQLQVGWFGTLSGLLHPAILAKQTQYYQSLSSRKTGPSWGRQFILQLWSILHQLWIQRNHKLHDTTIHENHGISHLHFSIQVEHHLGPLGLPKQYNGYFNIPLNTLLQKNIEYKKRWFNTIRRARELRNIAARDTFAINTSLRRWVYLPKTSA